MKDRIVNLADPGGRRYLRFSAAIEFAPPEAEGDKAAQSGASKDSDKEFQARVRKFTPLIEDAVVTVLSSRSFDEVRAAEGREQSKREIKARVQAGIGATPAVTNVYFTEFVVQ
jgi:flagellar FliL protein